MSPTTPTCVRGQMHTHAPNAHAQVPQKMQEPWTACRTTLLQMLSTLEQPSLSAMQRLVTSEYEVLVSLDPTFAIEATFLKSHAEAAVRVVLQDKVLAALPSSAISATLEQASLGCICVCGGGGGGAGRGQAIWLSRLPLVGGGLT